MARQPTDRSVVVTGASSGIGEATALFLDNLGYNVIAGVRQPEDAKSLQEKASERLSPMIIDITDLSTIDLAVETLTGALGEKGLAGLVNNAGIAVAGPLEFLPLVDIRTQFEVNVIGQIAVTKAFLPLLRQGKGRIINISSIAGRMAVPNAGSYAISKFALEAMTDAFRQELKPWDVDVVSIQPGIVSTALWDKMVARMVNRFPDHGDDVCSRLYGAGLIAARQRIMLRKQQGMSVEHVAKAVARVLAAKRPKTRYLVGADAKIMALFNKLLPDRAVDWLIHKNTVNKVE